MSDGGVVVFERELPGGVGAFEGLDGVVGFEGVAGELLEAIDEFLQAVFEGHLWGVLFGDLCAFLPFTGTEDLALDERAVFLFEGLEFWEGLNNGEAGGVTGVDAGDEGVYGVVEEFAADASGDELGEAFLDIGVSARDEGFCGEAELCAQGEEWRGEEGDGGGGEVDGAGVTHDEAFIGGGVGVEFAVIEAGVLDELADDG